MDTSNGLSDAQNLWSIIGAAIGTIILAVAAYIKKPGHTKEEGSVAVISAQFADRTVVEKMAASLSKNTESMEQVTEMLGELVELLKVDAQRRHDEAIRRDERERWEREQGLRR